MRGPIEGVHPLLAPVLRDLETTTRRQRQLHRLLIVDPMDGEEVQIVDPQQPHGLLDVRLELLGILAGQNLGLQEEAIPPVAGQGRRSRQGPV